MGLEGCGLQWTHPGILLAAAPLALAARCVCHPGSIPPMLAMVRAALMLALLELYAELIPPLPFTPDGECHIQPMAGSGVSL